ncbi:MULTISPECIES: ABC transporter ATP-binding protein [unclassified Dietzia]|uniref:ABC transporter ATP-binding protein n=1 Tax=unclassified Dietzia TaxID=2617939 RepID=UPI000D21575E|nr:MULTISPECIES: ABC transporter ATP-binding protein [unclassified Dietzia]AVZ40277.1 branched-chain amino acid ABC transporter ATP-binding protein [Dietzia sp. JS16-p6b]QGW25750.1 ABC transporter [Dietzia sp. DQ12-45-1b]
MLEARELCSGYGQVDVLRGLSVRLAEDEVVAVVGSNGAGKSTLVRTLTGLLPVRSGRILLDGDDIGSIKPHARARRGLIMVPEGRRLFGSLTVRENIELGRSALAKRSDPDPFEVLGDIFPIIQEREHQRAGLLSGGEQQQVALARALVGRPRYLLLDEPSLGLSPALTSQLFETITKIRENLSIGILLVEQMVDRALGIADRAYVIERGTVTLSGVAADVAGSSEVRRSYLGDISGSNDAVPPSGPA